jgi:twitching motility protein PilJ
MKEGNEKTRISGPILFLSLAFIALVGFVVFNLTVVFTDAARDKNNLELVSELRALSYRISGLSREATEGREEAFAELESVMGQMEGTWQRLSKSGEELPDATMRRFEETWSGIQESVETILADKETIIFLNDVVATLNERLPQLQQEHTRVVELLLDSGAPADQVAVAQAQSWRAERIGRNVDKMLAGGEDAEIAADQFNRDANLFGRVLQGMKSGDRALGISRVTNAQAQESLERISTQFEFVSNSIEEIFEAAPALFRARQATEAILDQTPSLLENIAGLADAIGNLPQQRTFTNQTALAAGILAAVFLALIGLQIYAGTRRRLRESAEANEKNQQAILRLLDEIEGLGDGDLTAQATVTEDFTGAIADAINFAILQLRELVARIQDTAENVSAAANETRATAMQLTESSEHQAQEIAGASAAINEMAITIDQVSANASESAAVADKSVRLATNGATVVQSTVTGMDTIREQIQDTSKRIKRLGESSQEIGDIVSLIGDIADQTNILALNAAIQASMAGDAGRGFAVVADEVQRLAERSANATKQISTLVNAIQTDTNEAVSSMEQTTSEVVKGAELAHDAGSALGEIQTVSTSLAELIQDISTAARHQATTAGHISNTMNVIQDITSQTLAGTNNTANSIGELAEMSVELREFVSGFKLPVDESRLHRKLDFEPTPETIEETDEGEDLPGAVESGEIRGSAGYSEDDRVLDYPRQEEKTDDAGVPSLSDVFEEEDRGRHAGATRQQAAHSELEDELADIDLGEFDIDSDSKSTKHRA